MNIVHRSGLTSKKRRFSPWQRVTYRDISYLRVKKSTKDLERGLVRDDGSYIPSYPHVRRIYTLSQGLRRHFGENRFVVEEKIDGFNVRVAMINDGVVALTRSGLVCPFSTEHVPPEIINMIQEHQSLVVCAEVVGPNPYNSCSLRYGKRTMMMVFDIINKEKHPVKIPRYLGYHEKKALCEQYGVTTVPELGTFTIKDIDKIKHFLLALDEQDREGVVFKEYPSLRRRIKYITAAASKEAIIQHLLQAEEPGVARFHDKFLLATFFHHDMGLSVSSFGAALGKELFEMLEKAIQEEEIQETLEIEISEEGWSDFKKMVRHAMIIRELSKRMLPSGKMQVRFKKIYPRSSSRIKELLRGRSVVD